MIFNPDRMIIINLYSGKYTEHQEGNEKRNLRPELDGRYYGYCPPYDNIDIYRNFNCKKMINMSMIYFLYMSHGQK